MAKIEVHVLNFHGIWSRIEIVLKNTSTIPATYYGINSLANPSNQWEVHGLQSSIDEANSIYSFDIDANPDEIAKNWQNYWLNTDIGKNGALAAQWFLTAFAGIPKPDLSNVSVNHLAFGIMWPSFIPCPMMLPGRVMSNAKFYIEAKNHPEQAAKYTRLFLYASMALGVLTFAASMLALSLAIIILGGGIIGSLVITTSILAGLTSAYGFFKAYNISSAKDVTKKLNNSIHNPVP
jgi:hypothetical protein